jgi:hypothetical protein
MSSDMPQPPRFHPYKKVMHDLKTHGKVRPYHQHPAPEEIARFVREKDLSHAEVERHLLESRANTGTAG